MKQHPFPAAKTKFAAALLIALCLAGSAWGVSTSHWVAGDQSDFKGGTLHNVVITSLGDVKLSRAMQTIQEQDPNVATVNALAEAPDGTIYAGTGPKGILLAVTKNKVTTAATLEDSVNILSLAFDDKGSLLLGTGGAKGKVLRIDKPGDQPHEIFSADDVQYIWALQRTADGNIYAATGPNGQVFEIKPDGSHSEIYKASQDNITSLISDGKDLLYLGTDPDGLVVRLDRKTRESFILYNAGETEITALALDKDGNLYAATGEAGDRQPHASNPDDKAKSGRPESDLSNSPIPANPAPTPPKPPEAPDPNPGEPKPIPKKQSLGVDPLRVDPSRPMMMAIELNAAAASKPAAGTADLPGQSGPSARGGRPTQPRHPSNPAMRQNPGEQRPEGNAIYKIDKEGFVNEVFRRNVVIYSMVQQNELLLVGTGIVGDGSSSGGPSVPQGSSADEEATIYQVNPAAEETLVLAQVDAKQIMCLLPAKDGRIITGLANTGGIAAMTGGYAPEGTYTSPVLDATQASRFGSIQLHGQLPDATTLKIATRSGNVKDSDAPGWSKWSQDTSAAEFVKIPTPSARFFQYRLSFATTDAAKTALVDRVDVSYQIPNLAPVIKSIKLDGGADDAEGGPPAPNAANGPGGRGRAGAGDPSAKPHSTVQQIAWEASDPNSDPLTYSLYFRLEPRGEWILLKDKIKEASYEWDTKTVADGRYQVKVVASDAGGNPPGMGKTGSRVSSSFVVDNTPPRIGDILVKATGGDVSIDLTVLDQTSIISAVAYTVDSHQDWQAALPIDNMFDSPQEKLTLSLKGLTPGTHQVTIRATDSRGNQSLQTVIVKAEGPAKSQ